MEDVDEDVQDLLGQLDETDADDYIVDRMSQEAEEVDAGEIEGNPSGGLATEPVIHNAASTELLSAEDLKPTDIRKTDQFITPVVLDEPQLIVAEPPLVDVRKELENLDSVISEVLQGTRADRQETQDAINLCRTEIDKATSGNNQPLRMWVDNLAKVLEVKATINLTAVKAMESKAKLLAAMKVSSVNVQTNVNNTNNINGSGQDRELVELLAANPLVPGDD